MHHICDPNLLTNSNGLNGDVWYAFVTGCECICDEASGRWMQFFKRAQPAPTFWQQNNVYQPCLPMDFRRNSPTHFHAVRDMQRLGTGEPRGIQQEERGEGGGEGRQQPWRQQRYLRSGYDTTALVREEGLGSRLSDSDLFRPERRYRGDGDSMNRYRRGDDPANRDIDEGPVNRYQDDGLLNGDRGRGQQIVRRLSASQLYPDVNDVEAIEDVPNYSNRRVGHRSRTTDSDLFCPESMYRGDEDPENRYCRDDDPAKSDRGQHRVRRLSRSQLYPDVNDIEATEDALNCSSLSNGTSFQIAPRGHDGDRYRYPSETPHWQESSFDREPDEPIAAGFGDGNELRVPSMIESEASMSSFSWEEDSPQSSNKARSGERLYHHSNDRTTRPSASKFSSPFHSSDPRPSYKTPGAEMVSEKSIEISPGQHVRLRGADETWRAIACDFFMPCECICCCMTMFCIQDAHYVLCPDCRVVSLMGEEGGDPSGGGVGLGFKMEDLARWQEEIRREQEKTGGYGKK